MAPSPLATRGSPNTASTPESSPVLPPDLLVQADSEEPCDINSVTGYMVPSSLFAQPSMHPLPHPPNRFLV